MVNKSSQIFTELLNLSPKVMPSRNEDNNVMSQVIGIIAQLRAEGL